MRDDLALVENPYEPPVGRLHDPMQESERPWNRTYERDPRLLTAWLTALLYGGIGLDLLSIVSNGMQIVLLNGGEFSDAAGAANDTRQQAIAILQLALFLPTAILFLKWVARANRNVTGFGAAGLTYSPNLAAGCYFIPLLNLVWPYKAMREIWQASRRPSFWQVQPVSRILNFWWALWLLDAVAGRVIDSLSDAETMEDLIRVTWMAIGSDVLSIALTVAALAVVREIARMQQAWVRGEVNGDEPF